MYNFAFFLSRRKEKQTKQKKRRKREPSLLVKYFVDTEQKFSIIYI